jgi:hypothetical protein
MRRRGQERVRVIPVVTHSPGPSAALAGHWDADTAQNLRSGTPAYRKGGLMRIRSWLVVAAALVAALAGNWAAAGPAGAVTRTGASGAGSTLSPATQRHLLGLFARYRGIPVADIASIARGAVLGPRASNGRDWAMISFRAASRAPVAEKVKFQDGAGTGVFTRKAGHAWTVAGVGGVPVGCGTRIPLPVRRAWHVPNCATAASPPPASSHQGLTAGTVGNLVTTALDQVGVSDNPASTSFGYDCNPYTTLVGNPKGVAACGTTTSNGSWFSNVENDNEEWCADLTKWVWEQAGVNTDLGTLNPLSGSFYNWGVDQAENLSFNNTPQVGDAAVFYPAGDSITDWTAADHVGIVTAVNSNGTVNLVDGDFLGSSNISVQYNTDWTASSYAVGEQWVFVSPQLQSEQLQYCYSNYCLNGWNGGPYVNAYTSGVANNDFVAFYNSDTGYENIEYTGNGAYSDECVSDYGNSSSDARAGLDGYCETDQIAWGANFQLYSCGDGAAAFENVHWGGWLAPSSLSDGAGFYLNNSTEHCFSILGPG